MRAFLARLLDWLRRDRIDGELQEELTFHRQRLERDARDAGVPEGRIAAASRRALGSTTRTREAVREGASLLWLDHLATDVRIGLRALRRTPTFTVAALGTLALGIGATTVIFSVAWAIWLQPLPYRQPDRLVSLGDAFRGGSGGTISVPEVDDYARTGVFDGVAAFQYGATIMKPGDEPVRVLSFTVSPNLFDVLGVSARLGHTFTGRDTIGAEAETVVLSDRLWRQRFHADTAILGRSIEAFGGLLTVVGVMPAEFRFPEWLPSEMWVPRNFRSEGGNRGTRFLNAVARLRDDATPGQVQAAMSGLTRQLAADHPDANRDWAATVSPLVEGTVGAYRGALGFLLGTVGLLLLIACANIASLLLARTTARRKELAVRVALGADRARVTRLVLTESTLLAVLGGGLGILLARLGVPLLGALFPSSIPRADLVAVSAPVILFSALLSLATGIVCGLAPSWRVSALAPAEALQSAGRAIMGAGRHGLQEMLVVGEVALSLMLLVGAGMMLRSFLALTARDHGFAPAHVLTMHITLPFDRYGDANARRQAFEDLAAGVRRVPGVADAAEVTGYPGSSLGYLGGGPIGPDPGDPARQVVVSYRASGPAYFRTMQATLLAGRDFDQGDRPGSPSVAIVNRELAARLWPGEDPVGRTLRLPASLTNFLPSSSVEVVGVVGDMRLGAKPAADLFVPLAQVPMFWSDLVVRVAGDPETHANVVRSALRAIEPDLLIEDVAPMQRILARQIALQQVQSVIAAVLGVLGCVLADLGLFGLLSYLVNRRMPEFGVRIALGATRAHIFTAVLHRGLSLTGAGITLGAIGAFGLVHLLRNRLFGLQTTDVRVFAAAACCMTAAAIAACWLPARRATRAHPVAAMRVDA